MRKGERFILGLMLAGVLGFGGAAWAQSEPKKGDEEKAASKSAPKSAPETAAKGAPEDPAKSAPGDVAAARDKAKAKDAAAARPDYVIGVDDVLGINVWREPEMSRVVAVRPDGKITLPLLGEFVADGKTPLELEAIIVEKIQTLVTNPEVSVIVQEIRSQKFNVVGEVMKPGTYMLASGMTVLDAMAVAGGLKDFAKPKKMYILRKYRDGTSVRLSVNYPKIIAGEAPGQNIALETRDTIVVP
ncbi:MAG: polysaccharide biosynthesis/export family protein [Terriglobales bacterium]